MPQLPTRPPLTGRINAQNPLTRGLVFAWAPGFSLQDFTTGKPLTLASVGSTTPNGSINIGRATRDRYTINTPISGGGSVSFLAVSEQYTANDGISFGAMNLAGSNEHIKFSGAMYVGPFGTSRYVSAATNPESLTDPYTYSGSIRSGVTNGTKIWCNSRLLFTGTVTTSPPAQLGLLRHSSNSATSAPLDEGYLWLIWNRALSDEEMRRAQENPWQVLETTKLATSWLPMFSVGGGATGTLSATLGALTSAATGTVQVRGASTQTLGALTSASSGTVAVVGSSSNTLGALTSTSAGTVAVVGTASNTLGALTLSSAGTTATGPVGTLSATLGSLTSSAAGTVQVRGTSTQTLGELTSASAGAVRVAGSLSATLGALTLAGGNLNASTGGLSATLDGLTVVAVGTAPLVWTVQTPANASWAAQSSSGSWVVQSVTASSWVLVA